MADDNGEQEIADDVLLQDATGTLFLIPRNVLAEYAVDDDVAQRAREVLESADVSGFQYDKDLAEGTGLDRIVRAASTQRSILTTNENVQFTDYKLAWSFGVERE